MARIDGIPWMPRGLCREEAAYYVGVGTTKFDQMVEDGRMPRGKRIDGRVVWDRIQLDAAFSEIDTQGPRNVLDDAMSGKRGTQRAAR